MMLLNPYRFGVSAYGVWDNAYDFTAGTQAFGYQTQTVNDAIGSGLWTFIIHHNPDSLNAGDAYFSIWETFNNNRSIMIRNLNSTNLYVTGSNTGADAWSMESSAHGMSTGTWYQIAVVVDLSESTTTDKVKFFINGSQLTSSVGTGTITSINTADYTTDGAYGGWGGRTGGTIAALDGYAHEVCLLDTALSGAELTAIWNSGVPISPRDNHNANVVFRPDTSTFAWNGVDYDGDDEILGSGAVMGEGTINGNMSATGGIY